VELVLSEGPQVEFNVEPGFSEGPQVAFDEELGLSEEPREESGEGRLGLHPPEVPQGTLLTHPMCLRQACAGEV